MEFIRKSVAPLLLLGMIGCTSQDENPIADTERLEATEVKVISMEDPYLWLEEIEGDNALMWVKQQNTRSLSRLEANPIYTDLKTKALDIVNASERIPLGSIRNGQVYNFWQDEKNVRGLWRRASLVSFSTDSPEWETLIDFDALAESENKNWVFKGVDCYSAKGKADYKCLVSLSDGGKDAVTVREFDLSTKRFVDQGFQLPEAKLTTAWVDDNTLLVATNWGADGSALTESGYPYIVKRWTRGTPLEKAKTVFSGKKSDTAVFPFTVNNADGSKIEMILQTPTFFTTQYYVLAGESVIKLPLPEKSDVIGLHQGQLLFTTNQDWQVSIGSTETKYKTGSLLSMPYSVTTEITKDTLPEVVFEPNERQSIEKVSLTKGQVLLSINDNVVGKLFAITKDSDGWISELLDLPQDGKLEVTFTDQQEDTAFVTYEGFLTPDSLMSYSVSTGEIKTLKRLPTWFDADDLVVEQKQVASKDGTMIPFFVVHKKGVRHDERTPTLLYGYGGFQVSMLPQYSGILGRLWLERGGAYVLANIRGGGEFGPEWHQAGLKTNRQVIYDDFIAVAEWLVEHKLTSAAHLGIQGGSNGGLLMGVMLTQRPDLFNAVIVQVPLLDMLRYHLLLAGASWVGEYGSPDVPEEREWLEKMSPYHNFDPQTDYPEPFFVTSTKDDRVHPGHARKMAKLFEDANKPFLYYENTDGGHAASANLQETAHRVALQFTYLTEKLMPKTTK
ncbi:prolyl oligopeptidase family protein [Aestuariibacter sp. A3R04]|uniref:prolyl oligopeptidase family serine peptidase n=1 Tax=Aestuariibacter sp. A3R04 TaxID=2841571 RepID=UPI001C0A3747|nr:prolyl oligopeptidase family serine peptidase [Aestuariibacter sp. A3R04]MBU3023150.1 prolyl oligopeptidase family serine peptidase [Aestuariibacter sp. A3R04]